VMRVRVRVARSAFPVLARTLRGRRQLVRVSISVLEIVQCWSAA
jgi:hypothetical protein